SYRRGCRLSPALSFSPLLPRLSSPLFSSNDTAPTDTYTLSLHDALPIFPYLPENRFSTLLENHRHRPLDECTFSSDNTQAEFKTDRKSTRLNSSHLVISYAVFCLKKKIKK